MTKDKIFKEMMRRIEKKKHRLTPKQVLALVVATIVTLEMQGK